MSDVRSTSTSTSTSTLVLTSTRQPGLNRASPSGSGSPSAKTSAPTADSGPAVASIAPKIQTISSQQPVEPGSSLMTTRSLNERRQDTPSDDFLSIFDSDEEEEEEKHGANFESFDNDAAAAAADDDDDSDDDHGEIVFLGSGAVYNYWKAECERVIHQLAEKHKAEVVNAIQSTEKRLNEEGERSKKILQEGAGELEGKLTVAETGLKESQAELEQCQEELEECRRKLGGHLQKENTMAAQSLLDKQEIERLQEQIAKITPPFSLSSPPTVNSRPNDDNRSSGPGYNAGTNKNNNHGSNDYNASSDATVDTIDGLGTGITPALKGTTTSQKPASIRISISQISKGAHSTAIPPTPLTPTPSTSTPLSGPSPPLASQAIIPQAVSLRPPPGKLNAFPEDVRAAVRDAASRLARTFADSQLRSEQVEQEKVRKYNQLQRFRTYSVALPKEYEQLISVEKLVWDEIMDNIPEGGLTEAYIKQVAGDKRWEIQREVAGNERVEVLEQSIGRWSCLDKLLIQKAREEEGPDIGLLAALVNAEARSYRKLFPPGYKMESKKTVVDVRRDA
ncbi:hypothetical protein IAT40_007515 [Kwoniella sp. CBS 6097]